MAAKTFGSRVTDLAGGTELAIKKFPVRLTKKLIEDAPGIDEDAPVCRQYEISWSKYFLIVNIRNRLPGKAVLVSPSWTEAVDWEGSSIAVDLTAEQLKNCPEYDPSAPVNREQETRLFDFLGRPKYLL